MPTAIARIEQISDQGSGLLNEDQLTHAGNLLGVFDGASSLVSDLYSGKTGAWWASHLASKEFARNNAELFELGSRANKQLQLQMTAMGVEHADRLQCWSTSAAVCRLQSDSIEWLQTGDSLILAIDDHGSSQLLTPYHNHDRETLQQLKQLILSNAPEPHKQLRPQIEKVRRQMNDSYGCINGDANAQEFFSCGKIPLSGIRHLLIFTDGLLPPGEDPDTDPDFDWLAKLYLQGGLEKIRATIREIEQADPHCRRYPRFKQHDDIAAIAISFN